MRGVLALLLTEFFQFEMGRTFRHAYARTVVSAAALFTFQPYIFSLALFSHNSSRLHRQNCEKLQRPLVLTEPIGQAILTALLSIFSRRYPITFVTTPAPTVLPPSRIANRKPSSIAIGDIISTSIAMLSPGMHISALLPSRLINARVVPVTSVVRK